MNDKKVIPVAEVMSPDVHTISGMDTVQQAIETMRAHNVSSLVVERRDEHDEYGMVVVSDVAKRVVAENRSPDRVNVYEIMAKPVLCVPSEMNIRYAVRMLTQFGVSRALVVDHDRNALGIVTLRDMVLRHIDEVSG